MDKKKLIETSKKIEYPLGDDDIKKFLPTAKVITNKDLEKYNDIDEIFDSSKPVDSIIILMLNAPNQGHWCALSKYGNIIEFFDSYGNDPNTVYNFTPATTRRKLGTGRNKLGDLLNRTKKNVVYNPVKYQEDNKNFIDINTCGRHVCFRVKSLLDKGMTLPEYYKMMEVLKKKSKLPYDGLIVNLI
jgi:hypothetical protein